MCAEPGRSRSFGRDTRCACAPDGRTQATSFQVAARAVCPGLCALAMAVVRRPASSRRMPGGSLSSGLLAIGATGVEDRLMLCQLFLDSRDQLRFDAGHAVQGVEGLGG